MSSAKIAPPGQQRPERRPGQPAAGDQQGHARDREPRPQPVDRELRPAERTALHDHGAGGPDAGGRHDRGHAEPLGPNGGRGACDMAPMFPAAGRLVDVRENTGSRVRDRRRSSSCSPSTVGGLVIVLSWIGVTGYAVFKMVTGGADDEPNVAGIIIAIVLLVTTLVTLTAVGDPVRRQGDGAGEARRTSSARPTASSPRPAPTSVAVARSTRTSSPKHADSDARPRARRRRVPPRATRPSRSRAAWVVGRRELLEVVRREHGVGRPAAAAVHRARAAPRGPGRSSPAAGSSNSSRSGSADQRPRDRAPARARRGTACRPGGPRAPRTPPAPAPPGPPRGRRRPGPATTSRAPRPSPRAPGRAP